jgi:hypothetical protein
MTARVVGINTATAGAAAARTSASRFPWTPLPPSFEDVLSENRARLGVHVVSVDSAGRGAARGRARRARRRDCGTAGRSRGRGRASEGDVIIEVGGAEIKSADDLTGPLARFLLATR